MERLDGRRLGWIAIGIGVVALLVSLMGRSHGPGMHGRGYGPWVDDGPRMGYEQRGYDAPPNIGPRDDAPQGYAQPYDQRPFGRGYGYDRHHGFGPGMFFWPFFLIGGLIKFLLFALLAGLLLRFLFKKNGWGGPWRGGPPWGGGGGRPDQPDKPGPEPQQQTYTGETRSL
jgi:hypothetical protein